MGLKLESIQKTVFPPNKCNSNVKKLIKAIPKGIDPGWEPSWKFPDMSFIPFHRVGLRTAILVPTW